MSATETLRNDHNQIKRLEKVISKCYQALYDGKDVPFSDIEKITIIISEFLDSIHYSREENSYFPCVASYDSLKKEIKTFLIEHEFGRRVARQIAKQLQQKKGGFNAGSLGEITKAEQLLFNFWQLSLHNGLNSSRLYCGYFVYKYFG